MKKDNKSTTGNRSDDALLDNIRQGDAGTIQKLYDDYFPMVLHFIITNNGDEDEAKDIFQEAVMVLYDKVQDDNFELSSKLKTFLYAVCRRLWLKQLAQQHRSFHDVTEYEDYLVVEDDLERHRKEDAHFELMGDALDKLGEPCRTIILDFYISNLSMQAICDKLGYTNADNAKTQKYKCLQRLRKIFFTANDKRNEHDG